MSPIHNGRSARSSRNDDFENAWFSQYNSQDMAQNLDEIKSFAFQAFDQLDVNHNGFIEREELEQALVAPTTGNREKSFISFLLSNQEAIAEAYNEEWQKSSGISRDDIQAYFALIEGLV